jgi:hypothetical protein
LFVSPLRGEEGGITPNVRSKNLSLDYAVVVVGDWTEGGTDEMLQQRVGVKTCLGDQHRI